MYVSEEIDEDGFSEVYVDIEEVGEEVYGPFWRCGEGAGLGEAGEEQLILPHFEKDIVGTDPVEQPLQQTETLLHRQLLHWQGQYIPQDVHQHQEGVLVADLERPVQLQLDLNLGDLFANDEEKGSLYLHGQHAGEAEGCGLGRLGCQIAAVEGLPELRQKRLHELFALQLPEDIEPTVAYHQAALPLQLKHAFGDGNTAHLVLPQPLLLHAHQQAQHLEYLVEHSLREDMRELLLAGLQHNLLEERQHETVVVERLLRQVSVVDSLDGEDEVVDCHLPVVEQLRQQRHHPRPEMGLDPEEAVPQQLQHQLRQAAPTLAPQTGHVGVEGESIGGLQQHLVDHPSDERLDRTLGGVQQPHHVVVRVRLEQQGSLEVAGYQVLLQLRGVVHRLELEYARTRLHEPLQRLEDLLHLHTFIMRYQYYICSIRAVNIGKWPFNYTPSKSAAAVGGNDMRTHSKYNQVLLVGGRLQNVPPFQWCQPSLSSYSYTLQSKQIAYYPNTSSFRYEHNPSQSLYDFSPILCSGYYLLQSCGRGQCSGLTIVNYFTWLAALTLVYPSLQATLYISDYCTSYLSQSLAPVRGRAAAPHPILPTVARPAVSHPTLLIISTMLSQDAFTTRLLANNLRPDGRDPLQHRQPSAHFMQTKGHLLFKQGATSVVVKTKTEVVAPRNERPTEGNVFFKVDCSTCQGNFQDHRKLANEAVKLLQTVVVGSKALDPQSLCILSGRYVWKVSVECSVCTDDGNILECLLNGVVLALMDVRKPLIKLTGDKIEANQQIQQGLSLAHIPVSLTLALTDGNLIADPTASEERVSKSRITVTMNVYKQLCSIHKPGGMGITEATLSGCVKLAEQRVKETTEWLRATLKERTPFRIC